MEELLKSHRSPREVNAYCSVYDGILKNMPAVRVRNPQRAPFPCEKCGVNLFAEASARSWQHNRARIFLAAVPALFD
jgi:hypothetical protein